MGQIAADSFTGAAGTELAAYNSAWSKHPSYTASVVLSTAGRLRTTVSTAAGYLHSVTPPSADYSVSADLYLVSSDNSLNGPIGRASPSALTFYHARYGGAAQQVQLYRFLNGSATQLGSGVSRAVSVGGTINLRLEMSGSVIKVYADASPTPLISQTNSEISAAGRAGFRLSTAGGSDTQGLHFDNFSADAPDVAVSVALGLAAEVDVALPRGVALPPFVAAESAAALPLSAAMPAMPAVEVGVALTLGVAVGSEPAIEFSTALPMGVVLAPAPIAMSVPAGRATEIDVALAFGIAVGIRPAAETDAALQLAVVTGPPVTFTRAPAGAGYAPGVPVLHRPAPVATARPHIAAARRPTR